MDEGGWFLVGWGRQMTADAVNYFYSERLPGLASTPNNDSFSAKETAVSLGGGSDDFLVIGGEWPQTIHFDGGGILLQRAAAGANDLPIQHQNVSERVAQVA